MILLAAINSKFIHSNPAVYYLKAYAEKYKDEIHIEEYTINQNIEEIIADIFEKSPDVLAFSCYIWNRCTVERILREIPKILPECRVILGGPEAGNDADSFLKDFDCVDAVIIGEGEKTFCELCGYYVEGRGDLRDIRGLKLRDGFTAARELLPMDDIPFFYSLWENEEGMGPFDNKIIYYETSRGCPFRCSYCLSSIDRTVRLRSLEKVFGEIDFFLRKKVRQVKFVDRTFNCNKEHALQIWKYIRDHDNNVTNFHFEIAADLLTPEELSVISGMRPGLIQLEIGVQTTNPVTMEAVHRRCDMNKQKENIEKIRSFGNTHCHLDLIAGLPYEDIESFRKSFNDVYEMHPDQLQLGFLKVLKGTEISEFEKEFGIRAFSEPPYEVLSSGWLGYGDIIKLKKIEALVETYYNSGQFSVTLPRLAGKFESPFGFFEELADYFDRHGLFINQSARIHKYKILLDFASERFPDKRELFGELLTCDLYLRENMKNRPDFARDLTPYKKEIYSRKKNRNEHIEVFFYPVFKKEINMDILSTRSAEPYFVLFDYDRRSALDHNVFPVEV
ncbi:MAG: B12-binding domain-containing radical SAM protein [Lachnospiraceae bacterium]